MNFKSLPLLVLILISALVVSCEEAEENDEPRYRQIAVETLKLEPVLFEEYINVTGRVEAIEDAIVSTEAGGRVQNIVRRGQRVNEGDLLVSLDDELLESAYEVARAEYELARDTYERQEPLLADSIITTLELNTARARLDQARAQLRQAERQLNNTDLKAPFPGRVEERMVKTGELIGEGMPVVRLVDTRNIQVNAGIAERYSRDISEGTPVVVDFDSYGGDRINAEVNYAGSVINPDNRTFPIEIEIENPDGGAKPDMMADVSVLRSSVENAIVVPRTAVFLDQEGRNVFVVNRDEDPPVAEVRSVEVGPSSSGRLLITGGLEEGDEIVVIGRNNLNQGDRLQIQREHEMIEDAIEARANN